LFVMHDLNLRHSCGKELANAVIFLDDLPMQLHYIKITQPFTGDTILETNGENCGMLVFDFTCDSKYVMAKLELDKKMCHTHIFCSYHSTIPCIPQIHPPVLAGDMDRSKDQMLQ